MYGRPSKEPIDCELQEEPQVRVPRLGLPELDGLQPFACGEGNALQILLDYRCLGDGDGWVAPCFDLVLPYRQLEQVSLESLFLHDQPQVLFLSLLRKHLVLLLFFHPLPLNLLKILSLPFQLLSLLLDLFVLSLLGKRKMLMLELKGTMDQKESVFEVFAYLHFFRNRISNMCVEIYRIAMTKNYVYIQYELVGYWTAGRKKID